MVMAIPGGIGNFQANTVPTLPNLNGNAYLSDSNTNSIAMAENIGLIGHSAGARELVQAPTTHLMGFTQAPSSLGRVEVIIGLQGNSLIAEQDSRANSGLAPLNTADQKTFVNSLKSYQSQYVTELKGLGATILYTYQIVYNGIAVVIDGSQLHTLDQIAGISSISQSHTMAPALDTSVPFLLGGQSYADLGTNGTGTTIAIIDTGIDYTHADFGGSGNPADYANMNPNVIAPGTFPTAKVIGGYDLVGTDYDAGCPAVTPAPGVCSSIPNPDPNPIDEAYHGTHVAGIAAGIGTDEVSHGVAPGANLYALKVFGKSGSVSYSVVIKALEMAVDPNGDGSTSDHVDVINLSLGSDYGTSTSPEAIATDATVDAGVVVAAAAGNSGNLPYVAGSGLEAADKAISVAAGNDPSIGNQYLNVAGSSGADGNYVSIESAFTPLLKNLGTVSGLTSYAGDGCSAYPANSLAGQIPLIIRGSCTFVQKVQDAQNAGAIGVIVFNNAGDPIVMGGTGTGITIPAFMISYNDGASIVNGLTSSTVLTLDPANFVSLPEQLASFSSAGPRFGDSAIKPDITAPGVDIFSAGVGTGTGCLTLSGTSMATPHIAGAVALLKSEHPSWTPQQIKSALMNTATDESVNGQPYPVSQMGAGRAQVNVAIKTQSLVAPASLSFGMQQSAFNFPQTFSQRLQVQNLGTSTKTYTISADFQYASDADGSISFSNPAKITVKPGKTGSFTFSMKVNFAKLTPQGLLGEYDGFVTLTDTNSGAVLRVPFMIIPLARSAASVDFSSFANVIYSKSSTLKVNNYGISGTSVDVYQLGVWDQNENLIPKQPGYPRQPDNWFDIEYTGAHEYPFGTDTVLEFATLTYGNRNIANRMTTEVYIDVNGDGVPDYVILTMDYGYIQGNQYPDGRMVTFLYEYTTGLGFYEFFTGNDPNTAVQTVPILVGDLNYLGSELGAPQISTTNPTIRYFVVTTDLDSGATDTTGTASFNVITPTVDTAPNFFYVDAGASESTNVITNGKGSLLLLYYNNYSGFTQGQVIPVGYSFSHHH